MLVHIISVGPDKALLLNGISICSYDPQCDDVGCLEMLNSVADSLSTIHNTPIQKKVVEPADNWNWDEIIKSQISQYQQPDDYLVKWEIDIDAKTPYEAAKEARAIQMRPESEGVVFEVVDKNGLVTVVDLHIDILELCLGLKLALEELESDDNLKLWEVDIGLFNSDDNNTPFEDHTVYVAAEKSADAIEQARSVAEDKVAVAGPVCFAPLDQPNEVDKGDFINKLNN